MTITNTQESFVYLWRKLEDTRDALYGSYRRFCIHNIMDEWSKEGLIRSGQPTRARRTTIDNLMMRDICRYCEHYAWDLLPPPRFAPDICRDFLKALVASQLNIGILSVDHRALDAAYSIVFPQSTPINKNKKKK